ncbi:thiamine pyrophosphate-dependent enzyme [Gammaproteobacteria bacterium]|nr:thiamine pyrophosphate-dependent enzyme [Gammaproteobacteria bacterium]
MTSPIKFSLKSSADAASHIASKVIELCSKKKAAHMGGALSITDFLSVYYSFFHIPESSSLFYSKGHACTALYAALGYFEFFDSKDLESYADNGSIFTSHVSHYVPGVELSTGSLGHALSVASGVSYAKKIADANHRCFIVLSDGELNEGSNWEALLFIAHHKLPCTIVIDYNQLQSFGRTNEVLNLEPLSNKFEAFNLKCQVINGHDHLEIFNALSSPDDSPQVIVLNTIKGHPLKYAMNTLESHYYPPSSDQLTEGLKEIKEHYERHICN